MSFKPEDSTDHESDSDSEVPKLSPVKVRFGIPLQAQDAELGTESFVSLDGQIRSLKRPEEITTSVLPAEDPPDALRTPRVQDPFQDAPEGARGFHARYQWHHDRGAGLQAVEYVARVRGPRLREYVG